MSQIFFARGRGFSAVFLPFLHFTLEFLSQKKKRENTSIRSMLRKGSAHKLGRFCACACERRKGI